MPLFQLQVALALVACEALSALLLITSKHEEGKVKLPQDDSLQDPFDVTKPEDIVDGEPVDEAIFWARVRLRKLLITFLSAAILGVQCVSLGCSVAEADRRSVGIYALHVAFALYILVLAARSVKQHYDRHAELIVHLSVLTTIAMSFLAVTAILPSTTLPIVSLAADALSVSYVLWYVVLALYFVTWGVAVTTARGPALHYPSEHIYSAKTLLDVTSRHEDNVSGITGASVWDIMLFSYTTKVVMLGSNSESLDIADLPIVPGDMRATHIFATMRTAMRRWRLKIRSWQPQPGSGWELGYRMLRVNLRSLFVLLVFVPISASLLYAPAFFLQQLLRYLEADPTRSNRGWGWIFCVGLFFSNVIGQLITSQLSSLASTTLVVRLRLQLNTILFAKTLVRKDVASSAGPSSDKDENANSNETNAHNGTDAKDKKKEDKIEFSSKAQVMTLMTTDVDRVADLTSQIYTLIDSPIELAIATIFLYHLLGVSCLFGLAVTCLFMPLNHFAGKVVVGAQDNLMKARDQRVALMNEVLGGIRMLKFMAWERNFENRVLTIRDKELKYQQLNYAIEVFWNAVWNGSPILVTLVSFWHFSVVRGQVLTPSIAFTSISVFEEMKYALNNLPETLINALQSTVSLRRIEKYLNGAEIAVAPPLDGQIRPITLQSATITWPQIHARAGSTASSIPSSAASTPRHKFMLVDMSLNFPLGELSLICGKLGSGKTLLLLALLGEADLLTGQLSCPRSPPDALAAFQNEEVSPENWIVQGICAYVPQTAWLRNASIRDNILFDLPYVEERYQKTLEVCALLSDLKILEDGDMSEIGERGVNLSGGQKARVSLARAVYSRASTILLDDILSAVDAHTAHHLFYDCLKGDLMRGRTVILVSHHVQLCAPSASYVIALDNGHLQFQGNKEAFMFSEVLKSLSRSGATDASDEKEETLVHPIEEIAEHPSEGSETISTTAGVAAIPESKPEVKKVPRRLVEEEKRAVGRISKDIWLTYLDACGGWIYWIIFATVLTLGAAGPVLENWWIKIWSGSSLESTDAKGPVFYISVYAAISSISLIIATVRFFVLYRGGIHASRVLHKRLLEGVLFANIRFHDTISRGRLLNRFGKDLEGIDSVLPDNFGRSVMYALSALTTFVSITFVGGFPFFLAAVIVCVLYFSIARAYSRISRDMRRLDSVTRSPLYTIYGETIAGVTVIRAFGASSKYLRDMLCCVDTNMNPYYWKWGLHRWMYARFNLLSSVVAGVTALVVVITPSISASTAGFALAFANSVTGNVIYLVRRFVGLEQSLVAVERIKEFTEIKREAPEFIEPRPPAAWPTKGEIKCESLCIRYAPDLPDVLHNLNFEVHAGEKVGILGRTGSGKSTLALSFFRFVEPTEGRIVVDGLDISNIGLTDLRSKLTIIPQDPTVMSGTLRSTLDVFNEYEDAEIYEALRRVHLIPTADIEEEAAETVNANVFRNLDSPVSEGGDNFSTGEKQLLCMARAILKRTKVLVMDEATASVDYATDELIGKTIRHEFAESTILTIAHRLRTIIDYDRVMVLDEGHIVEFDKPATLLKDTSSSFHSLCKATGKNEFGVLKKMAGVYSCGQANATILIATEPEFPESN